MAVSQTELFKVGMELEILEGEEVVDRLLVKHVGRGGVPLRDEIDVESLDLHITRLIRGRSFFFSQSFFNQW